REDNKNAEKLIEKQLEICAGWLENLQKQHQTLGAEDFINAQVFLFRIGQIKAMIEWLKNCKETLPSY
ncbi:MAG: hypothetical protein DRI65_11590, partial [Chloroflexota bacterium]